ncbi:MAG TPA: hypothetical protein VHS78_00505 [Candidatus Elarobacter sp.]|nr:hypothetical protein [Candidatus Elarobacter sp.]
MNPFGHSPAQQFRLAYELLPRILGTGRAKTTLDLLVLDANLDENSLAFLSRIQWLNWHLAELPECAEMNVHVHVPEDYAAVRAFFEARGMEYWIHEPVDASSPMAVRAAVVSSDCDAVLARDPAHLKKQIEGGLCIVTDAVEQILETVDIYARGFDVPWSSRGPHKDQPWTAFYLMSDLVSQSEPFTSLLRYANTFETAAPEAREALRVMIYNTIPNLCYGRDRLLFYQMQM